MQIFPNHSNAKWMLQDGRIFRRFSERCGGRQIVDNGQPRAAFWRSIANWRVYIFKNTAYCALLQCVTRLFELVCSCYGSAQNMKKMMCGCIFSMKYAKNIISISHKLRTGYIGNIWGNDRSAQNMKRMMCGGIFSM